MKDLSRELGIAMVVITHNLGIVARYADRVNVMYAARLTEQGTARELFAKPLHPYTAGLLRSVPRLDRPRGAKLETIEGLPPNLLDAAAGLPLRAALPREAGRLRGDAAARSKRSSPAHYSACLRARELAQHGPQALGLARPRRRSRAPPKAIDRDAAARGARASRPISR